MLAVGRAVAGVHCGRAECRDECVCGLMCVLIRSKGVQDDAGTDASATGATARGRHCLCGCAARVYGCKAVGEGRKM